jgi:hypothetical protein
MNNEMPYYIKNHLQSINRELERAIGVTLTNAEFCAVVETLTDAERVTMRTGLEQLGVSMPPPPQPVLQLHHAALDRLTRNGAACAIAT